MKDSNGKPIEKGHIVLINGASGWIWQYEGQWLVAWDIEGASCEDSQSLEDIMKDKFNRVIVVGKMEGYY